MKTLFGLLTGYLVLLTPALAAPITPETIYVINYQANNLGYEDLAGSFSGRDDNQDGWLTAPEVTDWYTSYKSGATYSSLNDIGDFDIFNRVWIPNALQWDKTRRDAYMTWNDWQYSASTMNGAWEWSLAVHYVQGTPDEPSGAVPVPPSLLLFLTGLGLLSLTRRDKNAQ